MRISRRIRTFFRIREVAVSRHFADEERPETVKPIQADRADVRALSRECRTVRTEMGFNRVIGHCDLPGTRMVPAACAMRSLLALKLQNNRRHTHVMSAVLDEGLVLFAGLNVIPKRSFLTEYSCRIPPACYAKLMRHWFDAMTRLGLKHGSSFDLDFHTIPFHGEDALLEKHYATSGLVFTLHYSAGTVVAGLSLPGNRIGHWAHAASLKAVTSLRLASPPCWARECWCPPHAASGKQLSQFQCSVAFQRSEFMPHTQ